MLKNINEARHLIQTSYQQTTVTGINYLKRS